MSAISFSAGTVATLPLEDDPLYEVVDGHIVVQPAISARSCWLASVVIESLAPFVRRERLGRANCHMLYEIDAGRLQRRPSGSFVSFERWPNTTPVPKSEAWPVVPELAVEVISPSKSAIEIKRKIGEYFTAGVHLIWVVYPEAMLVEVYDSPTSVRILDQTGELDGGHVLPGFRLALLDLFEDSIA